jgi:lipoate-protein ligase A
VTQGKFLTRNSRKDIIWSPHDNNWDIDKNKPLTQGQIINHYKLVVNRKKSRWLPRINEDLDVLKIQREEITYKFIQILQESRIKALNDVEKSFPHVIAFQKTVYDSLEQIKNKISLPSNYPRDYYNPVDRFKELKRIFKRSNQIYKKIGIL